MKVLQVHNYYQQPGGEDQVFAAEGQLLDAHGHQVLRYTMHNDLVRGMNPVSLAWRTISRRRGHRDLRCWNRCGQETLAVYREVLTA